MSAAQDRVYPNPGSTSTWIDAVGREWHRRGDGRGGIDAKRARRLLRNPDVALVTWQAGQIEWIEGVEAKKQAAAALEASARHSDDVEPSEWKSATGDHILMLEHHC